MEQNGCTHDCSSCSQKCGEKDKASLLLTPNAGSHIKKIVAVMSGKGGVGKSYVTTMLAVAMSKQGKKVGVLDADLTGPSIPNSFGLLGGSVVGDEAGMDPVKTKGGISVMSVNLLLEDPGKPVVWRGPVLAGVINQFYTDVKWGELDYLFIDMPPGTADVALTLFQSLPIDGVVMVTSPQSLVEMIVKKALNMTGMMNLPLLGIVENFSYFRCPDCGKEHAIFGESSVFEVAEKYGTEVLARLPFDPAVAAFVDEGNAEAADPSLFAKAVDKILSL